MIESFHYSLQELPRRYPFSEYRRRLVAQGAPLHTVVNGDEIGLQRSCGRYTLLATNYDYFEGCHHWIYLLDQNGRPVDQVSMPDQFGFMQDVEVVAQDEVAFGYFGTNDRWNVSVSERGFYSYKLSAMWSRLNRFLFSKHRLDVRRTKGAPWSLPAPNNFIERADAGKPASAAHGER